MKKLILFFIAATIFFGCSKKKDSFKSVPKSLIKKADEFVIAKTGNQFFEKYIKLDEQNSKPDSPYFFIQYDFKMPEKDFVDEKIHFYMDAEGNIVKGREVFGIPDCAENPKSCEFNVTKEQVEKLATEVGIEKDENSRIDFRWNSSYGKYVWSMQAPQDADSDRGQEVIIDANSGMVLSKRIGTLD